MSGHSLEVTFLSFKLIQQRLDSCITDTKKSSNVKKRKQSVCSLGMNLYSLARSILGLNS